MVARNSVFVYKGSQVKLFQGDYAAAIEDIEKASYAVMARLPRIVETLNRVHPERMTRAKTQRSQSYNPLS